VQLEIIGDIPYLLPSSLHCQPTAAESEVMVPHYSHAVPAGIVDDGGGVHAQQDDDDGDPESTDKRRRRIVCMPSIDPKEDGDVIMDASAPGGAGDLSSAPGSAGSHDGAKAPPPKAAELSPKERTLREGSRRANYPILTQ